MDSAWLRLVLIAGLVAINAAMAASEIALISLSETQIDRLAESGRGGRALKRLYRDPNRFLATIQVGITLAGFLASATTAVALADRFAPTLAFLGDAAGPAAVFLLTLVLSFVTLVFGELAPKRLAMQHPQRVALVAAPALAALEVVARPLVWLLSSSTDLVVRALGGDPSRRRGEVDEEEVRDLVRRAGAFSEVHARVLSEALDVADLTLRDVLVPRTSIVAIEGGTPVQEARRILVGSGHTRAPVYREDLDHVIGVAHILDLADAVGIVDEYVRPVTALPEVILVLDALRQLQRDRLQMAIVIDEHGGTEGMVTVEDLVEELVGEIFDEFDPDLAAVERAPGGSYRLRGDFPIHDLPDIGIELPGGDYTTVTGLLMDRLGRIPEVGDSVEEDGWRLTVTRRSERTVAEVRVDRMDRMDRSGPPPRVELSRDEQAALERLRE